MRGLFFVHLYAALEYAVNSAVERLLNQVSNLDIEVRHFESRFLTVALDPQFSALRNVGEEKRWTTRLALLNTQVAQVAPKINPSVFAMYLQNIWAENIRELFDCLHIDSPISPDLTFVPYIDEVVNKRNGVAHGRFSALGLGGSMRSPELEVRLGAISEVALHVVDTIEHHAATKAYVAAPHRSAYNGDRS